jgi:hypothetical protein
VQFPGRQLVITRQVEVGIRTNDVIVVAWIDKTNVILGTQGVDQDVLDTLPFDGAVT